MCFILETTRRQFSKDLTLSWIREAEERLYWANVINVMSINPKAMKAVNDMNNAITFGSSALSRTQEEAIATAVSVQNECRF